MNNPEQEIAGSYIQTGQITCHDTAGSEVLCPGSGQDAASYWSSITGTFGPDWAWALYLAKGAIGVGQKQGPHFYVWAVFDMAESGN